MDILEAVREYPQTPGVYLIKNRQGIPIYIGKARKLQNRLLTHFRPAAAGDYKEKRIQREAARVDIIQTSSEAEALLLEASLVKEYGPKYNKELKDDKSYPFVKITLEEDFPRLRIVRGRQSDGSIYYGPYTSAYLLKQAISLLRRLFPLRTCQPMPNKACLMYHIGQCHAPCEGKQSREEYAGVVHELKLFLDGKRDVLIHKLQKRMQEASKSRQYEEAKIYRDQMRALSVVSDRAPEYDRKLFLDKMCEVFGLGHYPRRIEIFDISNFQGRNPVASMVCFENGLPRRAEYRRFHIKTVEGIDDYESMREVVRRRYERLLSEKKLLPDLVLIDGGKGHLSAAREVLESLNLADIDILSIAKRHEYIFKPGRPRAYVLPQNSPILHLFRHMRDEAHRFAITFYRRVHRKAMTVSQLDQIPGIGPKRKTLLLRKFKTVSKIKSSSAEALARVRGIDLKTAGNIADYFKKR